MIYYIADMHFGHKNMGGCEFDRPCAEKTIPRL